MFGRKPGVSAPKAMKIAKASVPSPGKAKPPRHTIPRPRLHRAKMQGLGKSAYAPPGAKMAFNDPEAGGGGPMAFPPGGDMGGGAPPGGGAGAPGGGMPGAGAAEPGEGDGGAEGAPEPGM
jgi:hypothetical protein